MNYRDTILQRLQQRDNQRSIYHDIINTNNQLLEQIGLLKQKETVIRNELQKEIQQKKENEVYSGNQERVLELDRRIKELNEERIEMYKTQSENAQRLVNLNEQLRAKEEKEIQQSQLNIRLQQEASVLKKKHELQIEQLREKDKVILTLQDELSALHLEMLTTEERNKKLKTENDQLIQRWINKMNEEAENMNEATQFYENALLQARSSKDKKQEVDSLTDDSNYSILPSKIHKRMNVNDPETHCITSSSAGTMIAVGGADKKVKLYDAKTGSALYSLSGAMQTIMSVCFNSTDEMILAACTDNATRIWSLGTHRIRHTFQGHFGKVYAAKFTADSNRVISGSHDRTLKLWDVQKGRIDKTIFTFSSCNDLCLMDGDGQTIISGHLDNSIRFWDTRSGLGTKDLAGVHQGQITSVSMSHDGYSLLTNSRDNTLKIIDVRMYEIVKSFEADTYKNGLNWNRSTFSPDSNFIVAGSIDGGVHIWNVKSGKLESVLSGHG
ncbi:WD40-repeat-containing domain protein [Pilobolus umbonatus]|nr:WD40-repeat-containing domain protein [Pilobolus umbonatus]